MVSCHHTHTEWYLPQNLILKVSQLLRDSGEQPGTCVYVWLAMLLLVDHVAYTMPLCPDFLLCLKHCTDKTLLGINKEKWQHREAKYTIEYKENETDAIKTLFCSNDIKKTTVKSDYQIQWKSLIVNCRSPKK